MMRTYKIVSKRQELQGKRKSRGNRRTCEEIVRLSYLKKEEIETIIPKLFDNKIFKKEELKTTRDIYQGKISGIEVELHYIPNRRWELYLKPKPRKKLSKSKEEDKLGELRRRIVGIVLSRN